MVRDEVRLAALPVREARREAGERPHARRRSHEDAGAHGLLLARSRRLAQRGRARQVRLRALLRAHDVPRHEEGLAGRAQRVPQGDRRRKSTRLNSSHGYISYAVFCLKKKKKKKHTEKKNQI